MIEASRAPGRATVALYWIPLGAGSRVPTVKWSGRLYERLSAWRQTRPALDLYHAALEICVDDLTYAIEMAPAWGQRDTDRGVTVSGPVGFRALGRIALFRYEVRRWPGGVIPDRAFAVGDPLVVTTSAETAHRVMSAVDELPRYTWGRDEVHCRDMWNSNSVVAFVVARAGVRTDAITPPPGGRAPGWRAGLVAAAQAKASTGGHEQTR